MEDNNFISPLTLPDGNRFNNYRDSIIINCEITLSYPCFLIFSILLSRRFIFLRLRSFIFESWSAFSLRDFIDAKQTPSASIVSMDNLCFASFSTLTVLFSSSGSCISSITGSNGVAIECQSCATGPIHFISLGFPIKFVVGVFVILCCYDNNSKYFLIQIRKYLLSSNLLSTRESFQRETTLRMFRELCT